MAVTQERMSVTYRDAKGQITTANLWIKGAADANAQTILADTMLADMNALTNAAFQSNRGPNQHTPIGPVYGAVAVYENVTDKAKFLYYSVNGSRHFIEIPAPKSAIFQPDGQTIDTTNAAVATFLTDLLANCTTRQGLALQGPLVGVRVRRPIPRRATLLVLAPDLIGPEE